MTGTNPPAARPSLAGLATMPLAGLHDLPGCQCPEHQPAPAPLCSGCGEPGSWGFDDDWCHGTLAAALACPREGSGLRVQSIPGKATLADHTAAAIDAILGA